MAKKLKGTNLVVKNDGTLHHEDTHFIVDNDYSALQARVDFSREMEDKLITSVTRGERVGDDDFGLLEQELNLVEGERKIGVVAFHPTVSLDGVTTGRYHIEARSRAEVGFTSLADALGMSASSANTLGMSASCPACDAGLKARPLYIVDERSMLRVADSKMYNKQMQLPIKGKSIAGFSLPPVYSIDYIKLPRLQFKALVGWSDLDKIANSNSAFKRGIKVDTSKRNSLSKNPSLGFDLHSYVYFYGDVHKCSDWHGEYLVDESVYTNPYKVSVDLRRKTPANTLKRSAKTPLIFDFESGGVNLGKDEFFVNGIPSSKFFGIDTETCTGILSNSIRDNFMAKRNFSKKSASDIALATSLSSVVGDWLSKFSLKGAEYSYDSLRKKALDDIIFKINEVINPLTWTPRHVIICEDSDSKPKSNWDKISFCCDVDDGDAMARLRDKIVASYNVDFTTEITSPAIVSRDGHTMFYDKEQLTEGQTKEARILGKDILGRG